MDEERDQCYPVTLCSQSARKRTKRKKEKIMWAIPGSGMCGTMRSTLLRTLPSLARWRGRSRTNGVDACLDFVSGPVAQFPAVLRLGLLAGRIGLPRLPVALVGRRSLMEHDDDLSDVRPNAHSK